MHVDVVAGAVEPPGGREQGYGDSPRPALPAHPGETEALDTSPLWVTTLLEQLARGPPAPVAQWHPYCRVWFGGGGLFFFKAKCVGPTYILSCHHLWPSILVLLL